MGFKIKKKFKKTGAKAEKKEKKEKVASVKVVEAGDLSKKAKALIKELDSIKEARERELEILPELKEELGASSFEHPDSGDKFTIMCRGENGWFWRPSPTGPNGGGGSKKASKKAGKKKFKKSK